jgi:hypothetical protein
MGTAWLPDTWLDACLFHCLEGSSPKWKGNLKKNQYFYTSTIFDFDLTDYLVHRSLPLCDNAGTLGEGSDPSRRLQRTRLLHQTGLVQVDEFRSVD